MTRYILVGGYPHKASDGGKAFAEALVEGCGVKPKILDCLFARPEENWDSAYAQDQEFFNKHLGMGTFELQRAEVLTFVAQVAWADTIYVRGGSDQVLTLTLNSIEGWKELLQGKTFAGSSAGADAIAQYYYALDTLTLDVGLGLLPVKVIPHWKSDYNAPHIDWDKAYGELDAYKEKLPILTLREGEFMVIRV